MEAVIAKVGDWAAYPEEGHPQHSSSEALFGGAVLFGGKLSHRYALLQNGKISLIMHGGDSMGSCVVRLLTSCCAGVIDGQPAPDGSFFHRCYRCKQVLPSSLPARHEVHMLANRAIKLKTFETWCETVMNPLDAALSALDLMTLVDRLIFDKMRER